MRKGEEEIEKEKMDSSKGRTIKGMAQGFTVNMRKAHQENGNKKICRGLVKMSTCLVFVT